MKCSSYLVLLTLAGALATPLAKHVIHEKRDIGNHAWIKRNPAGASSILPMRIGLVQRNLDHGHNLLMEMYAFMIKHLSEDEVFEMFAPSRDSERAVIEWLESSGIALERISISRNRQWVQFDAQVSDVESLLLTEYHIYEHEPSRRINVACDEYHVPDDIQKHIDYINPGIKLFPPSGPKAPESFPKRELGGQQLAVKVKRQAPPLPPSFILRPIKTVINFLRGLLVQSLRLGQLYAMTDIESFNMFFGGIPVGNGAPELRSIDGGRGGVSQLTDQAGAESNLDIQSSHHIIYPQGQVVFSVDDVPTQTAYNYSGFWNNYLDGIDGSYCSLTDSGITGNSNNTDPPLDPPYPNPKNAGKPGAYPGPLDCGKHNPTYVTSISYGGPENTLALPANYQPRQCFEFMKLALRGYTHIVASCDSGVATYGEDENNPNACLREDGITTGGGKIFNPDFPSNCPYILAVGSTEYTTSNNQAGERATRQFGSGGGFSNVHEQPSYQQAAAESYLTANKNSFGFGSYDLRDDTQHVGSNGGVYNAGGRGYPDVAALGANLIIWANQWTPCAGRGNFCVCSHLGSDANQGE
ncbi:hypothetical protein H072_6208 [Dactylellina haptotyla CBS 200.50]|uniref:Peptidase S53 domain-containing protein n=1 Tax=Dactylellina haptotyla (strain CBS 200.50) TaxID=1284197 RepID=S8AAG8_DACHA|nr:hypothetical protein H072_6208 [Dactylellina haptotyla CBS 200.50]